MLIALESFKYFSIWKGFMDWQKLLYSAIIILLYVPLVFMGANVFFPEYTGQESYYRGYEDCIQKYPIFERDTPEVAEPKRQEIDACQAKAKTERLEFEREKLQYEGKKYAIIAGFNLAILLLALFVAFADAVVAGLFFGAVVATFGATVRYFDTKSKIGFLILVITFLIMLFFISKRAKGLIHKK